MDKKLETALNEMFAAPPPQKKRDFLKKYHRRELGCWELLLIQARYIHWFVWGNSVVLFAAILWRLIDYGNEAIWTVSALIPFLALLAVTVNGKSTLYRMEELELACRISLRSVMLARMVILGIFHFVLLAVLTPALAIHGAISMSRAGVYLLTPYLFTAAIGMELARRIYGNEGILACGAAAAFVSILGIIAQRIHPGLYQQSALPWWEIALAVGLIAVAAELNMTIRKTEVMQWN